MMTMRDLFDTNLPDTPTPLNSTGGYSNAAGSFKIQSGMTRKVKSREDLDQPKRDLFNENNPLATTSGAENNSVDRYFGSFSLESKRHVWDLLSKHPLFTDTGSVRLNRVNNNTREVLRNDPVKIVNNGGSTVYEKP